MSIFGSSSGSAPRLKPLPSKRSHVVSVLDIGSTKVVCMIARLTPREVSEVLPGRTHKIEIIGIGHQRSRGIKSGVISDLDALEGVIRNAVDTAERQADLAIVLFAQRTIEIGAETLRVTSRQHRCAGRAAHGAPGMKIGETQAAFRERIDVRGRIDLAAIAGEIAVADIVADDQHEVRRTLRADGERRREQEREKPTNHGTERWKTRLHLRPGVRHFNLAAPAPRLAGLPYHLTSALGKARDPPESGDPRAACGAGR